MNSQVGKTVVEVSPLNYNNHKFNRLIACTDVLPISK